MKKVLLSLSVVALFGLASCNSEKDCECTNYVNGDAASTSTNTIEDGDCEDLNTSSSAGNTTSELKCEEV